MVQFLYLNKNDNNKKSTVEFYGTITLPKSMFLELWHNSIT